MAETAYISVASNLEPERNILEALRRLAERCRIEAISEFYVTKALDRPDQPDYLNGVIRVAGEWTPRALKFEVLRPIETALGRVRTADKYAARTIDLDLVLFGTQVIREPDLVVPDPEVRTRVFLAAALLDIAPDLVMPDTGEALADVADSERAGTLLKAEAFTALLKERFLE
ncbi:MAG TPA: 2-amino-4-hydroxy-6-hydroxymethyldihydropteridine diphosphokinase [Candidatus Hydrogenedentes bacterium]|nr:2-amino-4-hydroxy-6-hydroxymethyldihydropteridine diphosphokinase [Candidatus Hydrogenedentota bacterium]